MSHRSSSVFGTHQDTDIEIRIIIYMKQMREKEMEKQNEKMRNWLKRVLKQRFNKGTNGNTYYRK